MFVRSYNPVWYFVNNTGIQMDDTYYFFVLQNTFPYLPATVYHDNQGQNPWSHPIQLLPNGTLPTDIFFNPSEVYRLEWRHGDTQADQLVYEVNDYVPDSSEISPVDDSASISDNVISNGQFAFVDFFPEFTAEVAGTYEIAPGWFLELIGATGGDITITQEAVAGDENFPGNPPYVLNINAQGWTEVNLYQQFNRVSGIWANASINASFTGISELFNLPVSVLYVPSTGTPHTIIDAEILNTASYRVVNGGITLPASDNSDSDENAFVKFVIVLPPSGNVKISNIQLVSGNSVIVSSPELVEYIQEPIERQEDHLYHWYAESIVKQSKENILTGWDFSLNPFQFRDPTLSTVVFRCIYVADQTIVYQNAESQIQTGKNTDAQRNDFLIKAVASSTDNRFALIQYIDPKSIRSFWSYKVSCLAKLLLTTTHNTSIRFKMRLLYRRSLPPTISTTEPITTWVADQDPTFATDWTAIVPLNDPEYIIPAITESGVYDDYPAFSFDQFQLPDSTTSEDTLAVVFYTMDQMNSESGTEDSINLQSISMTRNDFAIDVSPLTCDETLRRCQFYYEKSYEAQFFTQPGTATSTAAKFVSFSQTVTNFFFLNFAIDFKTTKRIFPAISLYSVTGAQHLVRCGIVRNNAFAATAGGSPHSNPADLNGWIIGDVSTEMVYLVAPDSVANQISTTNSGQPIIRFHYTADSRLGI